MVERNNRKSNKTDVNAAVLLFLQYTTAAFIPAKRLPFYHVDLFLLKVLPIFLEVPGFTLLNRLLHGKSLL